jgi:hypothetical protein
MNGYPRGPDACGTWKPRTNGRAGLDAFAGGIGKGVYLKPRAPNDAETLSR